MPLCDIDTTFYDMEKAAAQADKMLTFANPSRRLPGRLGSFKRPPGMLRKRSAACTTAAPWMPAMPP